MALCEIPIPEGYEFVRWGPVQPGERYISDLSDCCVVKWAGTECGTFHRIIVRPVVPWPEWLTAPWVARDRDGAWWWYSEEPYIVDEYFTIANLLRRGRLTPGVKLQWPDDDDWRHSKRKNPNVKETA